MWLGIDGTVFVSVIVDVIAIVGDAVVGIVVKHPRIDQRDAVGGRADFGCLERTGLLGDPVVIDRSDPRRSRHVDAEGRHDFRR